MHHPDAGGDSHDDMAALNLAWAVLGDPTRRREYDLTLALPSSPAPAPATAPTPAQMWVEPARFPWRFLLGTFVVGVVVVIIGMVTASDPVPPTVDNVLVPGDCVVIESNGDAAERLCTDSHDGVVVSFLAVEGPCPLGSEPHRDLQGMGTACVRLG
jgi:hypothetical protein